MDRVGEVAVDGVDLDEMELARGRQPTRFRGYR